MSDNWLQFISVDPTWQPTPGAADSAAAFLRALAPDSDEINAEFKDEVEFFHPGANWSGVECPSCGADAEGWWDDAMGVAAERGFADLTVAAPCCGAKTSLSDLRYVWPAAFGRFVLEAMNPNISEITAEQERRLADRLGTEFHTVWVHI